ncbi:MAG TPA: AroM family protein [Microbacterium sp.]|nr:AroM family protein [Microbacterium sp.]
MSGLALITIGQAPRVDVTPDIAAALIGIEYAEYGALDLLSAHEIEGLRPQEGESVLVSRLRDGGSAVMSERRALPLVQDAVTRAARDGAEAILVMCTGDLPGLHADVPVYLAERLARGGADALAGDDRLAVLVPKREQSSAVAGHWLHDHGRDVGTGVADPYSAAPGAFAAAAKPLIADGARWIFLDCIGYSEAMADEIRALGVRVLTARTMAARLVAEVASR